MFLVGCSFAALNRRLSTMYSHSHQYHGEIPVFFYRLLGNVVSIKPVGPVS